MAKKSRIQPRVPKTKGDRIHPTQPKPGEVSLNFKRLTRKGKKFDYSKCESQYFLKLLERFKNVSSMSKLEVISTRSRSLRSHPIDFSDPKVSENTFGLSEDLDDCAWQLFVISQGKHGRVYGYFLGDVFYVVWLDPEHELYSK